MRVLSGERFGRLTSAACLAAVVLAIGCGDDGGDGEKVVSGKREILLASEPPRMFAERLAKLLATTAHKRDCLEIEQLNTRSSVPFGCPAPASLRRSMRRFEIVGADSYGSGAVVDYRSGELRDGAAILLVTARDRQWGVTRIGMLTEPSTGTSDAETRAGYVDAVERLLAAVRDRDCEAFEEVMFVDPGTKDVCGTVFVSTEPLARRLRDDPDAKPRYVGGNGTYGFVELETRKPEPENVTISVLRNPAREQAAYVVLDVAPSPSTASQRQIRREFERALGGDA